MFLEEQIGEDFNGNDLQFLLSVDIIVADDSVLPSIQEAVSQTNPEPILALDFIISLCRHRLGESRIPKEVSVEAVFPILDVTALSRSAWKTIMFMTATILIEALSRPIHPPQSEQSRSNATTRSLWIILSESQYRVPDVALDAVLQYFNRESQPGDDISTSAMQLRSLLARDPKGLGRLSAVFLQALSNTTALQEPCLSAFLSTYAMVLCDRSKLEARQGEKTPDLIELLRNEPIVYTNKEARDTLYHLCGFLVSFCRWRIDVGEDDVPMAANDIFTTIWLLMGKSADRRDEDQTLQGHPSQTVLPAAVIEESDGRSALATARSTSQGPSSQHSSSSSLVPARGPERIKDFGNNTDLRLHLDPIFSDPDVLDLMAVAVGVCRPSPKDIIPVIGDYLQYHLKTSTAYHILSATFPIPDLRSLSPDVHRALTDMIAKTLDSYYPFALPVDEPEIRWVQSCVAILLSPSKTPYSDTTLRVLCRLLAWSYNDDTLKKALIPYLPIRPQFLPISQHLAEPYRYDMMKLVPSIIDQYDHEPSVGGVIELYYALLQHHLDLQHNDDDPVKPRPSLLSDFLLDNPGLFEDDADVSWSILDDLWEYLRVMLKWRNRFDASSPNSRPALVTDFGDTVDDAFRLLSIFGKFHPNAVVVSEAENILIQTGTVWDNTFHFHPCIASSQPHHRLSEKQVSHMLSIIIDGHETGTHIFAMMQL